MTLGLFRLLLAGHLGGLEGLGRVLARHLYLISFALARVRPRLPQMPSMVHAGARTEVFGVQHQAPFSLDYVPHEAMLALQQKLYIYLHLGGVRARGGDKLLALPPMYFVVREPTGVLVPQCRLGLPDMYIVGLRNCACFPCEIPSES